MDTDIDVSNGSFILDIRACRSALEIMESSSRKMKDSLYQLNRQEKLLTDAWKGQGMDAYLHKSEDLTKKLDIEINKLINCYLTLEEKIERIVKQDEDLANTFR